MQVSAQELMTYAHMTADERVSQGLPSNTGWIVQGTVTELSEASAQAREHFARHAYMPDSLVSFNAHLDTGLTQQQAECFVELQRQIQMSSTHPKWNRPWNFVPIHSHLDPEQVWMGFEFETGFVGGEEVHLRVMDYLWNSFNHVAVDAEGIGSHPCEITMPPQNLSDYENGQGYIQRLLAWLDEQGIRQQGTSVWVGTHVNISTPAVRQAGEAVFGEALNYLNNRLDRLSHDHKCALFGRNPYGYGYYRTSGNQKWAEFKLFLSTDDREKVEGYIRVSKQLAKALDFLLEGGEASRINYEFLSGEDDL